MHNALSRLSLRSSRTDAARSARARTPRERVADPAEARRGLELLVTRAKRQRLRVTGQGHVREAAIEAALVPVVSWLCAQRAAWSLEQARAACPSVPARYVDALLAELAAQGFVDAV